MFIHHGMLFPLLPQSGLQTTYRRLFARIKYCGVIVVSTVIFQCSGLYFIPLITASTAVVCQSEEKVTVRPTVTVGKYIYRNKQQTKEETKFMHDCSLTDTLSLQSLTQQTG